LSRLEELKIPRCFKPPEFIVENASIHHFSDASTDAYGQVSFLRLKSVTGVIHCSFVISKARVAPLKKVTIPRLELTAAVTSVKIARNIRADLQYENMDEYFWTDSQVVIGYIANESKRFHLFVSNRIQFIRENTKLSQWRYVPSIENPADDASRGLHVEALLKNRRWLHGPDFL